MKFDYLVSYFPAIPALQIRLGFPEEALKIGPLDAIVDTGADGTLVPQALIDELNAPLVNQVRVRSHWGEWRTVLVFTIDIDIAGLRLPAVEVAGDPGQEVVLGRNVLNLLRLFLDGPARRTTLEG